jgi:site-specific DNA recombinase
MAASAYVYRRVSTGEQTESGAGLAAQLDACRAYAAAQDLQVAGVFDDAGVSGASGLDKRPGLLEAIAGLRRGDVLLVAKRDRLARDPIVTAMVEAAVARKGARLVSAAGEGTEGDSPTDMLMRRLIDAFSEFERHCIGARTRAAMQAMRTRGERVSRSRYGFRFDQDGRLVPVAAEQAVIEQMRQLRAAGHSLRDIAAELTRQGITTAEGKARWTHTTVNSILRAA